MQNNKNLAGVLNLPLMNPGFSAVHLLLVQAWSTWPRKTRAWYLSEVSTSLAAHFLSGGMGSAPPLSLERLAEYPTGSLGAGIYAHIISSNLNNSIISRPRITMGQYNEWMVGLPRLLKKEMSTYFWSHDFLHVLTGYDISSEGETKLLAFALAQRISPYLALWFLVIVARGVLIYPSTLRDTLDAVADGWYLGRSAAPVMTIDWTSRLDRDLQEVRVELLSSGRSHDAP
jgi:ubiquinone biosynthesis protein Coq4